MGDPTDALTRTAEDHIKAVWSAREWDGAPITVKELAERFGTTPAAASATLKRLANQGLVVHEPYGPILLTPAGERQAVMMVRRHRLIETFLVQHLGYGWAEVHDEAEHLEHAASDMMIDRIDELLGHPQHDPHGDPIPTREGDVSYPTAAKRLTTAGPGPQRIVRVSDGSAELLEWFDAQGLAVGDVLTVTAQQGGDVVVVRGSASIRLPREAAGAIIVVEA